MSPTDKASSSEDEAERSVESSGTAEKRARRRRGRRTRKKSERDSPASEFSSSRAATPPPMEGRKRTCSLGAPPAPRNTNDFLLEDMEKREEDGAKRVRREQLESEIASGARKEEEELTGEDEFEDQYEESWQECVVDKYKEMSHDELARRLAAMEKNRDEVERKLRWERSKSDYLQERLLHAEEQIRHSSSSDSPPPPVPSSSPYCNLPLLPNCSPHNNMISSPRA